MWFGGSIRLPGRPFLAILLMLAIAASISCIYSWHYYPTVLDDPFIDYRYAERLLSGKGLTWNDGEHVEGYSNLLWVLLVSLGGALEPNLSLVGSALGLLANLLVLAAVVWTFRGDSIGSRVAVGSGLFVLALSDTFSFWGTSGLETPLVDALFAWALAVLCRAPKSRNALLLSGVLLALLAITRPDGILLSVGITAGLVFRDGIKTDVVRRNAVVLIAPMLFIAGQIAFRVLYYGDVVPNTAYSKIVLTAARLGVGAQYVLYGLLINGATVVLAIVATILARLWRTPVSFRQSLLFFMPGAFWLLYVCTIGGDFFPFYRHMMPVVILLVFFSCKTLAAIPSFPLPRLLSLAMLPAIMHATVLSVMDPWDVPIGDSAKISELNTKVAALFPEGAPVLPIAHRIEDDCLKIGYFLREAFTDQKPLLAVNYAGCMPYASRLPALDMLGLNDSYIAHHRPKDIGSGYPAHELGDGGYVLSRKPDLVAFCLPATGAVKPCFRSETEMAATPSFQSEYRLLLFRYNGVDAKLWTRIENGRLGVVRTTDAIRIPGYLLATNEGVRGTLDASGHPVAQLEYGTASIADVYFPEGLWKLSLVEGVGNRLILSSPPAEGTALNSDLVISSKGEMRAVHVAGGRGLIYAVIAQRVSSQAIAHIRSVSQ